MNVPRPDRWWMHDPKHCGADNMPEGYPCLCGRFWPRRAAYWRGEVAIGDKAVARLMQKFTVTAEKYEATP